MGGAADAPGQCRLLAGPAALSAQLLLAALALASLAYKRCVAVMQHMAVAYGCWLLWPPAVALAVNCP